MSKYDKKNKKVPNYELSQSPLINKKFLFLINFPHTFHSFVTFAIFYYLFHLRHSINEFSVNYLKHINYWYDHGYWIIDIAWTVYRCRIILEASFSLFDKTFADNLGSVLILAVIVSLILDILIRFKCKRNFDIEYLYYNKSDIYIVTCPCVYRLSNCCNQ